MTVKELMKMLKTFPQDAEVLVRREHDDSYNPDDSAWDSLWPDDRRTGKSRTFYCKADNTVNIQ